MLENELVLRAVGSVDDAAPVSTCTTSNGPLPRDSAPDTRLPASREMMLVAAASWSLACAWPKIGDGRRVGAREPEGGLLQRAADGDLHAHVGAVGARAVLPHRVDRPHVEGRVEVGRAEEAQRPRLHVEGGLGEREEGEPVGAALHVERA